MHFISAVHVSTGIRIIKQKKTCLKCYKHVFISETEINITGLFQMIDYDR
jgi:hypothetical protein